MDTSPPVGIVIAGASGDLAKRKLFPSLFELFVRGLLPDDFLMVGFSRSDLTPVTLAARAWPFVSKRAAKLMDKRSFPFPRSFRNTPTSTLLALATKIQAIAEKKGGSNEITGLTPGDPAVTRYALMGAFFSRLRYTRGKSYTDVGAVRKAFALLRGYKGLKDRLYYLSVPPSQFSAVVGSFMQAGAAAVPHGGHYRFVVEKPFGESSASCHALLQSIDAASKMRDDGTEGKRGQDDDDEGSMILRMDHYLGKEMVQQLLPLRLYNPAVEAMWSNQSVEAVVVEMLETIDCEGRAGYFDSNGIIRDLAQNHLAQMLALTAMELPPECKDRKESLSPAAFAAAVRREKVKALDAVVPLSSPSSSSTSSSSSPSSSSVLSLGQYEGYCSEEGVGKDSIAPTFSSFVLQIENKRWKGVPFVLRCGKALDEKRARVVLLLKGGGRLVLSVQPTIGVDLRLVTKAPGFENKAEEKETALCLSGDYASQPPPDAGGGADWTDIPDAYTVLLRDALCGRAESFVGQHELMAAWRIFDNVLHFSSSSSSSSSKRLQPSVYAKGSHGPVTEERALKREFADCVEDGPRVAQRVIDFLRLDKGFPTTSRL